MRPLIAALVLLAACAETPVATVVRPVRLRLLASGVAGRTVDVSVFYTRRGAAARVPLAAQSFEVDSGARELPITVDVTTCLRDPERTGSGGCPISASVKLRDAAEGDIDSVTVGPVEVSGSAQAVELPEVVLRRTLGVRAETPTLRVRIGDSASVRLTALDAAGQPIAGRRFAWTSSDPRVLTVDSAGVVRPVAPGTARVTGTREGASATATVTVPVSGATRWTAPTRITGIGVGTPPAGRLVSVRQFTSGRVTTVDVTGHEVCELATGRWSCAATIGEGGGSYFPGYRSVWSLSPQEHWVAIVDGLHRVTGTTRRRVIPTASALLYAVWAADSTNVFAVGANGTVLRYDGVRATPLPTGRTDFLIDVWGTSPADVYVLGRGGTVLRWNGARWITLPPIGLPGFFQGSVWAADSLNVFAASGDVVAHYDGSGWRRLGPLPAGIRVQSLSGSSARDLIVAAFDNVGRAFVYRWNGTTFTAVPVPHDSPVAVIGAWSDGAGGVLVGGDEGRVTQLSASNVVTALSYSPFFGYASMSGPDNVVVSTGTQALLMRFDGTAWSPLPLPGEIVRTGAVLTRGASGTLFVGQDASGDALFRHDGRQATVLLRSAGNAAIVAIAPIDTSAFVIAQIDGVPTASTILRCAGATCAPLGAALPFRVAAVSTLADGTVWALGDRRGAARWTGSAWQSFPFPLDLPASQGSILALDSTNVLATWFTQVYRFDGTSWRLTSDLAEFGPTVGLSRLWGTAADDVYMTICGSGVHRFDGKRWAPVMTATPNGDTRSNCFLGLSGAGRGGVVAAGMHGRAVIGTAPAPVAP